MKELIFDPAERDWLHGNRTNKESSSEEMKKDLNNFYKRYLSKNRDIILYTEQTEEGEDADSTETLRVKIKGKDKRDDGNFSYKCVIIDEGE